MMDGRVHNVISYMTGFEFTKQFIHFKPELRTAEEKYLLFANIFKYARKDRS